GGDLLTRQVAGRRAEQPDDRLRALAWRRRPRQRDELQPRLVERLGGRPARAGGRLEELLLHRRVDDPRQDGVDADAARGVRVREAARDRAERGLRGAVDRLLERRGAAGGDGRERDDRAAVAQERAERLAEEVRRLGVDGDDRVPVLLGRLRDRLRPHDPVRDHEVVARSRRADEGVSPGGGREVRDHRLGPGPARLGEVGGDDRRAALEQQLGDGPPDPARGAGDRRPLPRERHSAASRSRSRSTATATISSRPRTTSCQNDSMLSSTMPLLTTPITSTPRIVPTIEPRPPARLAPPRTTAVLAENSSPVAALPEPCPVCEATSRPVSPTASPERTKPAKITRRVRMPARRAAAGLAPIA